ncbi:MAG: nucleoside deaminase [Planctomycetes bacterium]|nr:nucleoside deaminase [Planctomycetota bacterium]MCP4838323.1 nucleoside deaminase [Planctomycetota bacterium]
MQRAIELAEEAAERGDIPVGAVIYRGDEILGEGANRREIDNDPTAHAEVVAMRAAGARLGMWRLHECAMAVTLEPCPMCAGAMVNARLNRVVWGADDAKAGACRSLYEIHADPRLNHRLEGTGGVLADECAELLRRFFKSRRSP